MELRLPYPDGPKPTDTLHDARRKLAENLAQITAWADEQATAVADLASLPFELVAEHRAAIVGELRDGADEILRFADVVR